MHLGLLKLQADRLTLELQDRGTAGDSRHACSQHWVAAARGHELSIGISGHSCTIPSTQFGVFMLTFQTVGTLVREPTESFCYKYCAALCYDCKGLIAFTHAVSDRLPHPPQLAYVLVLAKRWLSACSRVRPQLSSEPFVIPECLLSALATRLLSRTVSANLTERGEGRRGCPKLHDSLAGRVPLPRGPCCCRLCHDGPACGAFESSSCPQEHSARLCRREAGVWQPQSVSTTQAAKTSHHSATSIQDCGNNFPSVALQLLPRGWFN